MLEVKDLHAYYGKSHILQGVDLRIDAGEVVSLLGRNGVGRSTTVKAIVGEVPPQGIIRLKETDMAGLPSFRIAHLGPQIRSRAPRYFPRSSWTSDPPAVFQASRIQASPANGNSTICCKCSLTSRHGRTPPPASCRAARSRC